MENLKLNSMKIQSKIYISLACTVMLLFASCNDFLEVEPSSVLNSETFYNDPTTAEVGLTGCYNRFFHESAYSTFIMFFQASTDDIKQDGGFASQFKNRSELLNATNSASWAKMYEAIANVNFLIEQVEGIPEDSFGENKERKNQIIAEGHFLRGVVYYYLYNAFGDVPLITDFPNEDINDVIIAKTNREQVLAQVKSDLTKAENDLPDVLENYADDQLTNQRKGRASKWAAKAFLARLALQENDYTTALALSEEIIDSGLYPFTPLWRSIFQHPGNASESIFEQQNDYSPGFFGSGLYAWFFGFDFEWSETAKSIFEKPDEIGTTQGRDVRFDLAYTPHPWAGTFNPNKYIPVTGFADGGAERMNFNIIRLSELMLNKAEAMNELNYAANRDEVLGILNQIRGRAQDDSFVQEWFSGVPDGTLGIAPLEVSDVDTQEKMREAIREEKHRELMFEDIIRWIDLLRWDKNYLKTITNSNSDEMLYWPIPSSELLRNDLLEQNPAYNF